MTANRTGPLRPSIRLFPAHSRDNSRSTSPERNIQPFYSKLDPLLGELSPDSTLHALTSTAAVPSDKNFSPSLLSQSISQVSPTERALGIRAAIAAQNLDLWYREVLSWPWPNVHEAKTGKGFIPPFEPPSPTSSLPLENTEVEHYGSLRAEVVQEYEKRIEEIRDGVDNLDVEELKEHVLNAHIPSRSRPSSSTSIVSAPPPLSYVQLSDFTAVVTATILRALPSLTRLTSLLTTWDVRLLVLRQVPGLLRELKATRFALDCSFQVLRKADMSHSAQDLESSSFIQKEHVLLENAVVAAGKRMDRCLDALEGHQDSLPESWIDDLERIELDFAAWVVEAERYKLRIEWLNAKNLPKQENVEKVRPGDDRPIPDPTEETEITVGSGLQVTELQAQMEQNIKPTVATTDGTLKEELLGDNSRQATNNSDDQQVNLGHPSKELERLMPTINGIKPSNATCELAEQQPTKQQSSRKSLQSPIKLSKLSKPHPAKHSMEEDAPQLHRHRSSTGSSGSVLSNDYSLISSHDAPGPRTDLPDDVHLLTPTRLKTFQQTSISGHTDHMLREQRLRRLGSSKALERAAVQQNRSVSLPLERFMNENLELQLGADASSETSSLNSSPKVDFMAKTSHNTPTSGPHVPPLPNRHPQISQGKTMSNIKAIDPVLKRSESNVKTFGTNTARRAIQHQEQPRSLELRKRLTAHPSLESLGRKRQELPHVEGGYSQLTHLISRASSPIKQPRKPRDHLDEKINSILSTLPGRIHLVDSNNELETSSSSLDHKMRDTFLSEAPYGPSSRSTTPIPSLTIAPAARRRYSHAHKMEDSYVKLYHLHHGGQTAPTKLFVRTVGEDGQRVMVRVGGGWADLGEYLREYVIHHGRRKVSETPRVEVQGVASRSSPSYPSPGSLFTSTASPPHPTSGRATPSRPSSVLSACPPSSLTVRKKRRVSNSSDVVPQRSVTTGALSSITSPPTAVSSSRQRLSVSSSYSSLVEGLPTTSNDARSTPLGLAGPKPRTRHVSMSPEGEAWVEDVLQQTRRSNSVNPLPYALSAPNTSEDAESNDTRVKESRTWYLPKVRSVGDIGSIGTSRRIVLRGLGNHR